MTLSILGAKGFFFAQLPDSLYFEVSAYELGAVGVFEFLKPELCDLGILFADLLERPPLGISERKHLLRVFRAACAVAFQLVQYCRPSQQSPPLSVYLLP